MSGEKDNGLPSLNEWELSHPYFRSMDEGIIEMLDDHSLDEESLGSGLAEMVKLSQALILPILDTLCRTKKRILACLKKTICKR